MNTIRSTRKSPFLFFLLFFALSSPFLIIGAVTKLQLLPGLPVSSLSSIAPVMTALILTYRENKTTSMIKLLKRSFDFKQIKAKAWYVPMFLLIPGVMVIEYGIMRLAGTPVPIPQFTILEPVVMFLVFFIFALGEELGWTGYAIDPLQEKWNALQASIILGLVWMAWHMMLLVQAGQPPAYIAWQSLGYIAERILFVWLYNNSGKSVFAVAVCHTMLNVSWRLYPVHASFYDPGITFLITASLAAIVIFLWGPRTLAQFRFGRKRSDVQLGN